MNRLAHRLENPLDNICAWLRRFAYSSLCFLVAACAVPISYYDSTTYSQLTSLKVDTTTLIESFDVKKPADNEARIEAVTISFRKAYEYEKGKGTPNSDTSKQFEKILKLFYDDIKTYRDEGTGALGRHYFSEAAKTLGQAFDIAIATENAKNKDKR
jgi:hypothetical protein